MLADGSGKFQVKVRLILKMEDRKAKLSLLCPTQHLINFILSIACRSLLAESQEHRILYLYFHRAR